jgi:hypothetical protein
MSGQHPICLFNEGQVSLPEGCQDRTVNVFTSPGGHAPSFNISRDTLNADENLAAYIDRQLALMQQHLKGWKQSDRSAAVLGDNLFQGEIIHASYQRDAKRIWQQQAVFTPQAQQILVFTMTSAATLTDADNARFKTLLRSFRLHA